MFNKFLLSLFISFLTLFTYINATDAPIVRSELLLDQQLKLTDDFRELLLFMKVNPDVELQTLINVTQKNWLRGKERWQEQERFGNLKEDLLPKLDALGFLKEVKPTKTHYNEAVVLGSLAYTIRARTRQLIEAWNSGVRFDKIVYLGADWAHPVDKVAPVLLNLEDEKYPFKKDWVPPQNMPVTEHEIIQCIISQTDWPQDMEGVEIICVNTPMQKTPGGDLRRPNTGDTIKEWLKEYNQEDEKSCLFFSSQPYVSYQDTIIRGLVPSKVHVETVGVEAVENLSMSVHLDNVARCLYAFGATQTSH